MSCILLTVRFHDGRYHGLTPEGRPEWPPSPARLFQALVAGAAKGSVLCKEDRDALSWLEGLEAPAIAAPSARKGQLFGHFVPNNALDVVDGDHRRIGKIRTATKRFHPHIFDRDTPFFYVWSFDHGWEYAERVCQIVEQLYQVGRGVDMAWAVADILDTNEANAHLSDHPGTVDRATMNGGSRSFACPFPGSLDSLISRYERSRNRFKTKIEPAPTKKEPSRMKMAGQAFSKPPRPRFRQISYNRPSVRVLYEMRDMTENAGFLLWPSKEPVRLVETARDGAAKRLERAYEQAGRDKEAMCIGRIFIGHNATEADKAQRIRILPLPSIGHPHVERAIRRLLIEIPSACPLPVSDIEWAFSGLHLGADPETGEILDAGAPVLVDASSRRMLRHYGIERKERFRLWRTVTPAALPQRATRRRVDPERLRQEANDRREGKEVVRAETKSAFERLQEESRAIATVHNALRHAGIDTPAEWIRVQREPFHAKGARAEVFASGTRFPKNRLWHVEIAFAEPRDGAIVIGDGRYLGLGLMAPEQGAHCHTAVVAVEGAVPSAEARDNVLSALHRA